jgi:outer membrane protein assembly factor BamB
VDGQLQLITVADPWVIANRPADGSEIWRAECVGGDLAPSPIYAGGHVYVANIYAELTAIVPGGSGDVTGTHIHWSKRGLLPDITSPLSNGRLVWTLSTGGVLTCWDAESGALQYEERLPGRYRTSPTLVGDRVYLIGEAGESVVVSAGRQFEQIATGSFGERVYSCPAFAHGRMYVRGLEHVFCVGAEM